MVTKFVAETRPDPCLEAHNKFRRENGVPELKAPSVELQKYANQRGHEMATDFKLVASNITRYGENVFAGGYGWYGSKVYTCADAVKSWYEQTKLSNYYRHYGQERPFKTEFDSIDTKQVACAETRSGTTIFVVVS